MMNDDTTMEDAPTCWSATVELELQGSPGAGRESQSQEGILPFGMKSRDELTNEGDTETVNPIQLSKFSHDTNRLGPESTIPSSLKTAEEPRNAQHDAGGIPEHQIQTPKTPRNLIHESQSPVPVGAGDPIMTARKSRSNLPKSAVATLKNWLQEHQSNPYPSENDKLELAVRCGLQIKQINYWFMNARKRILKIGYDSSASTTDIESLAPSSPTRGRSPQQVGAVGRSSSTETQASSCLHSDCEWSRAPKRGRKRRYSNDTPLNNRKRSRSSSAASAAGQSVNTKATFQCTFCSMSLSEKAWRRHEETQHVPQVYWKCMATGKVLHSTCVFCRQSVDMACLKDHRIVECLARDEKERMFHRKDNLKQHFRNFHDSTLDDRVARTWEVRTEAAIRPWPCGFCGITLKNWCARQAHITEHFRKGATMESWDQDMEFQLVSSIDHDESGENTLPSTVEDEHVTEQTTYDERQATTKLVTKKVRDDHSTRLQCPHPDLHHLDRTNPSESHCPSSSCFTTDFKYPSRIWLWHSCEPLLEKMWLWYCEGQSSLIIHVMHTETHPSRRVWARYKTDSIRRVIVLDSSFPSLEIRGRSIRIEFELKAQPMVFHTKFSRWKTAKESNPSVEPHLLSTIISPAVCMTFPEDFQYLHFITWCSQSAPLLVNHVDLWSGIPNCGSCPLSFQSLNEARVHQLYHEGAYVDILGHRLSRLYNHTFSLGFQSYKIFDDFTLETLIQNVEFKCGTLLPGGSSWGCKKLFIGLPSFRKHLNSAIGKICWVRLQQCSSIHTPARRVSLKGDWLSALARFYSATSGLPEVLYTLYPALLHAEETFTVCANTTLQGESHGSEAGMIETKPLSTIESVSTSRAQSSLSTMSNKSVLSSGRIQRNQTFISAKPFLGSMTEPDTQENTSCQFDSTAERWFKEVGEMVRSFQEPSASTETRSGRRHSGRRTGLPSG